MSSVRPRRSALYMPGSNARAIEKARELPIDVVILDLEDSVAPDAKAAAREQVAAAVSAGGFGPREVVIRVNGMNTPWFADDIAAAMKARPDAILVPKVNRASEVVELTLTMDKGGAADGVSLWAMIETPVAILHAAEIAAAARSPEGQRLRAFVLGTNDLAKETGARFVPGRAPFLSWLSTALIAGRSAGLVVLDGVYNDIADEAGFLSECEQGRDFGFDGKTLIHPKQVEAANRVFAPSEREVAQAREIIAAFDLPENAGKGAIALNGRMVERMHADIARTTVALSEAIAARS